MSAMITIADKCQPQSDRVMVLCLFPHLNGGNSTRTPMNSCPMLITTLMVVLNQPHLVRLRI